MNPALLDHPLLGELRGLVARLSLISHAPIGAYGGQTRESGEDIGGKPPRGGEVDRPRKPSKDASAHDWEAYHEEHAAWKVSYQRHTPAYFAAQLERCETEARLVELRDEAEASRSTACGPGAAVARRSELEAVGGRDELVGR